jgi:hypothetical protein
MTLRLDATTLQTLRLRHQAELRRKAVRELCAELAIFAALDEIDSALILADDALESHVSAHELDEAVSVGQVFS